MLRKIHVLKIIKTFSLAMSEILIYARIVIDS